MAYDDEDRFRDSRPKEITISIRLTAADDEDIRTLAQVAKISRNKYIYDLIRDHLKSVQEQLDKLKSLSSKRTG